jgi:hypothetical protein
VRKHSDPGGGRSATNPGKGKLDLHIVPTRAQNLFSGVDFRKTFHIAPDIISSVIGPSDLPHNFQIVISEQQRTRINADINLFPYFATLGLGRTDRIAHSIDVGNVVPIK